MVFANAPPSYYGSSPLDRWLDVVADWAKGHRMDDHTLLRRIPALLEGAAFEVYVQIPYDERTLQRLIEALKDAFASPEDGESATAPGKIRRAETATPASTEAAAQRQTTKSAARAEATTSEATTSEATASEATASEATASEATASEATASEATASEVTTSEVPASEATAVKLAMEAPPENVVPLEAMVPPENVVLPMYTAPPATFLPPETPELPPAVSAPPQTAPVLEMTLVSAEPAVLSEAALHAELTAGAAVTVALLRYGEARAAAQASDESTISVAITVGADATASQLMTSIDMAAREAMMATEPQLSGRTMLKVRETRSAEKAARHAGEPPTATGETEATTTLVATEKAISQAPPEELPPDVIFTKASCYLVNSVTAVRRKSFLLWHRVKLAAEQPHDVRKYRALGRLRTHAVT